MAAVHFKTTNPHRTLCILKVSLQKGTTWNTFNTVVGFSVEPQGNLISIEIFILKNVKSKILGCDIQKKVLPKWFLCITE